MRRSRHSILNVAWVGQGDYGDELMAFVIRTLLQKHGICSLTYYQRGPNTTYTLPSEVAVRALHRFNRWDAWRRFTDYFRLRGVRAVIFGGGSIIHSARSIRWKLDLFKRMPQLRFAACLGLSLGPFDSDEAKKLCGQFLGKLQSGAFRDSHSYTVARELNSNSPVIASLDLAVALPTVAPAPFQHTLKTPREPRTVGVALVQKKNDPRSEQFFAEALELINGLSQRYAKVILFSLYVGNSFSDVALNNRLRAAAQNPANIEIHNFDGDIFKTLQQFRRCTHVVGMRLHAIVSAYTLGIPFVSLAYHPKNDYFARSVNYPEALCITTNSTIPVPAVLRAVDTLAEKNEAVFTHALERTTAATTTANDADAVISKLAESIAYDR